MSNVLNFFGCSSKACLLTFRDNSPRIWWGAIVILGRKGNGLKWSENEISFLKWPSTVMIYGGIMIFTFDGNNTWIKIILIWCIFSWGSDGKMQDTPLIMISSPASTSVRPSFVQFLILAWYSNDFFPGTLQRRETSIKVLLKGSH